MINIYSDGGNCVQLPDHTTESVLASLSAGCAGLLLKVHRSREGEPVLRREADLAKSTNGTGMIQQTALDVLRQLDAADNFMAQVDAPWRRVPAKGYLLSVPALEDILWWLPVDYPLVVDIASESLTSEDTEKRFLERLSALLSAPPIPLSSAIVAPDL